MNLYGYEFQRDSDLAHYGVIGMKWGVRRYQQANGRLTAEGRRHLKREARIDNQIAYDLGRKATISGKALAREQKKIEKAGHISNRERSIYENLKQIEKHDRKAAEQHREQLVKKYGEDFVSHIRKTKIGTVSEKTRNYKDVLKVAAMVGLLTIPISAVAGGAVGAAFAGEEALTNLLLGIDMMKVAPTVMGTSAGKAVLASLGGAANKAIAIGAGSAAALNSTANIATYKSRKDSKEAKAVRQTAKKKK